MKLSSPRSRRLLLAVLLTGSGLCTASVNTASLMASATSVSCISWRVKGICYWLLCTPFGCSIKRLLYVGWSAPEMLVCLERGNPIPSVVMRTMQPVVCLGFRHSCLAWHPRLALA